MKITKLISAVQANHSAGQNAQPEWTCVVELEDGTRRTIDRVMQWNKPEVHHMRDMFARWPSLFETISA